jgi:nucleoside-diphosphate-sugar epimerase
MKKVLVTGGLGFIGHNVVAKLEDLGHDVLIIDNMTNYGIIPENEMNYLIGERSKKIYSVCHPYDIENRIPIDRTFDSFKPDIVIHLASFPRQKVVNSNPPIGARVMVEGLLNLCEAAKRNNVEKLVYVSSSMVYGDFNDGIDEYAFCKPQGQYAIMKHAGEQLVRDYGHKGCFDYTIVRPSAVYGPCDAEDRVISKFFTASMRNEVLTVNGETESLDFTYIDDTVSGIIGASLSNNTAFRTYNIARGESRTLLEAAELITKIVGKGKIEVTHKSEDYPSRGALSINAARKDFGYNPTVNIEDGFQAYYEWLSKFV